MRQAEEPAGGHGHGRSPQPPTGRPAPLPTKPQPESRAVQQAQSGAEERTASASNAAPGAVLPQRESRPRCREPHRRGSTWRAHGGELTEAATGRLPSSQREPSTPLETPSVALAPVHRTGRNSLRARPAGP